MYTCWDLMYTYSIVRMLDEIESGRRQAEKKYSILYGRLNVPNILILLFLSMFQYMLRHSETFNICCWYRFGLMVHSPSPRHIFNDFTDFFRICHTNGRQANELILSNCCCCFIVIFQYIQFHHFIIFLNKFALQNQIQKFLSSANGLNGLLSLAWLYIICIDRLTLYRWRLCVFAQIHFCATPPSPPPPPPL